MRPILHDTCIFGLIHFFKAEKSRSYPAFFLLVGMKTAQEFFEFEIHAGTILKALPFPEARKPAYILHIDFGKKGIKKSSAQITKLYQADDLIGQQVLAVLNFPPRQIGPIRSECLVLGHETEEGVVLIKPERRVENGSRLS